MSEVEDLKNVLTKLDQEQARVTVRLEFRRYRKMATIIQGLNLSKTVLESLTSKLKHKLATGGTAKDGAIILQGDQKLRVVDLLVEEGFQRDSIDVS